MIAKPIHRNLPLLIAAALAAFAAVALAAALSWRAGDQQRLEEGRLENCQAIEVLKAQLRPEPFDLAKTRQILADLKIDPDSETGARLIETGRQTRAKERAALAPAEC